VRSKKEKDDLHANICAALIRFLEHGSFSHVAWAVNAIGSDGAKVRVALWLKKSVGLSMERKKGLLNIGHRRESGAKGRKGRKEFRSELKERLSQGYYGKWYDLELSRGSKEWKNCEITLGLREPKIRRGGSIWTVSGGLPSLGKRS
jgi:hypothetical protein